MQSLKDKMYNYEVTPPSENWQVIATALDKAKNTGSRPSDKRSKVYYLSLGAAAAIAFFIFSLIFWNINSGRKAKQSQGTVSSTTNDTRDNNKITVPKSSDEISADERSDGQHNVRSKDLSFEPKAKKYITITGPQGQCVKISSKAAMLIVASDNQNPPKPVWSAKVNKWKYIMESNALAPTTANFLDIVELTHTLRVDN